MTQLSEQDRQRIEEAANDAWLFECSGDEPLPKKNWRGPFLLGYTEGATAERLLAESEKEELRKIADDLYQALKQWVPMDQEPNTGDSFLDRSLKALRGYENNKKK